MEKRVVSIICECLNIDNNLSTSTKICDLPFDSLGFVSMVIKLEEAFEIEFDADQLVATSFSTIFSLIEYIKSKLPSAQKGTTNMDI